MAPAPPSETARARRGPKAITVHVREMRAREGFDQIICSTLTRLWSQEHGGEFPIDPTSQRGEPFVYHPFFSAIFHHDPSAKVLDWVRAQMRFTPRPGRMALQWALTEAVSRRPLRGLLCEPAWSVEVAVPDARQLVIFPGNQRIRIMNLATGTSRVALKTGFEPRTLDTEIAIRGSGAAGPFPPITDSGEGWFEEPIVSGWALPRLPPWRSRQRGAREALERLEQWLQESATDHGASAYVERVATHCRETQERLDEVYETPWPRGEEIIAALVEASASLELDRLVHSHGDFQPGNVLVTAESDDVLIIDWEHGAMRSPWYDSCVWTLGGRANRGLAERLSRFVAHGRLPGFLAQESEERAWRLSAMAIFCLENLLWYQRESLTGPFRSVSQGLLELQDELERYVDSARRP